MILVSRWPYAYVMLCDIDYRKSFAMHQVELIYFYCQLYHTLLLEICSFAKVFVVVSNDRVELITFVVTAASLSVNSCS